jgi:hypothetical protein
VAAAGVFWFAWQGKREQAMIAATLATLAAIGYLKFAVLPVLDQRYSVRAFWQANARHIEAAESCLNNVRRDWAYGLNYYAGRPLPECTGTALQIAVRDGQLTMNRP